MAESRSLHSESRCKKMYVANRNTSWMKITVDWVRVGEDSAGRIGFLCRLCSDLLLSRGRDWCNGTNFNAPGNGWTVMAIVGFENPFESRLLMAVMNLALVQCVSSPTRLGSSHWSSFLDLVTIRVTEDIVCLSTLLQLTNSDHAGLLFMLTACYIIYYEVNPHLNVRRLKMLAIQECVASTSWSVNTSLSIEEAWSKHGGTLSLLTSPFTQCLISRRPNNSSL